MARLKILVIAPASTLQVSGEIAAIATNHNSIILQGQIRESDIQMAIRRHNYFDVMWFCTHGGESGIELSSSTLLSPDSLVSFVKAARSSLVVINSCSTEELAQRIVANGKTDCIYSFAAVSNGEAVNIASLLAAELAANQTYYEAFEIVAPETGTYRFLAADEESLFVLRRRGEESGFEKVEDKLERVSDKLTTMNLAISLRSTINSLMIVLLFVGTVYLWWRVEQIKSSYDAIMTELYVNRTMLQGTRTIIEENRITLQEIERQTTPRQTPFP